MALLKVLPKATAPFSHTDVPCNAELIGLP